VTRPPLERLLSLEGKRALITGAASGIGRAIASRFTEAGAKLELVDIDERGLDTVQRELEGLRADVRTWVVDLAQKTVIDQLWDALLGDEPDILVNCAGIYPFKDFIHTDEAFYRNVLEINLNAVYWMCQRMIADRGKRGGVIVNISSIEAAVAFKDDLAHYSISKAGVVALTRSLAREYGRHGFRVNAVMPGGILTPGTKSAAMNVLHFKFDLIKSGLEFMSRLPLGRLGQPDEVARIVLALSTDLTSYVQGAIIPVDGGFLAD
jgi:NAD(P)-dependent dehydrogenase (short-subunit alcohol dehydrogenase family)